PQLRLQQQAERRHDEHAEPQVEAEEPEQDVMTGVVVRHCLMWSSNRGANRQPCQNSPRPAYRGGVIAGVRRPHPGRCLNRDALFVLPLAPISFCSVSYRLDILDLEHAMSAASFRADARVIGLVATAHGVSHFFQLLLAPLFPWIRAELGLSYAELGALMAIFFIVSGVG